MKKFKVNENCISCGACVAIAGEVFDFDDNMQATAKKENCIIDNMNDEVKDKAMNALEGCPVGAIELIEVEKCNCDKCGDDCNCDDDCKCNKNDN